MGIVTKADHWIGKTLFVPLIIRFCQRAKRSQYWVANHCWLFAYLCFVHVEFTEGVPKHGVTWLTWLLLAITIFLVLSVGRNPDRQHRMLAIGPGFRMFFVVISIPHFMSHALGEKILWAGPDWDASCPTSLLILIGAYAYSITTIPPLEDTAREKAPKLQEAKTNG